MYHDFAWIMLIYRRPYREATILLSFTRIDVRSRFHGGSRVFVILLLEVGVWEKTLGSSRHFRSGSMGFLLEMFVDAYQNMRVFSVFEIWDLHVNALTRKLPYINFYRNVVDARMNIAGNFEMLYRVFFHNLHSQIVLVKCWTLIASGFNIKLLLNR